MSLLGRLLHNRRAGEAHMAWNRPNLQGPETLTLTSQHFEHNTAMLQEHTAGTIGGKNLSPHLAWSTPPQDTAQLLLVVEDIDVPLPKPAVHCVALIDPDVHSLADGALHAKQPAKGVRPLRATIGRGYQGPGPIKGHGPHRYVFQLFALAAPADTTTSGKPADQARPRAFLPTIGAQVLGRGRLTGTYER
ncbi:YbhB/YbcL family Raf kinase inhibitor-like protein [Streptomyces sp. SID14478]|uniref:YbhB/YbcL family Raf kinase inhibitor-like protein n=1 Tax=Streptomyces sp. SID14478 TaxID=2706073 RepID=UPI0013E01E61|nr:YbhB/YbcL family Raf kinase inhibitor-like protein [Streptomyces sp. SID14478]NEB80844.1 YbhB/YbcL family Raf kinase inhibitor-like protein [Streptomyces sp. SID14478]